MFLCEVGEAVLLFSIACVTVSFLLVTNQLLVPICVGGWY